MSSDWAKHMVLHTGVHVYACVYQEGGADMGSQVQVDMHRSTDACTHQTKVWDQKRAH